MTMVTRFSLTLATALVCALFSIAQAQTPRMATVNITPDADKVRIAAIGDVYETRVEVSDEQGDVVFQSGQITGQTLDWNMKDGQGERVPAGAYLVTVTFRNAAGKLRKRVEQVAVEEGEKASTQATAAPEAAQATPIDGTGAANKIAKFTDADTLKSTTITETANGFVGIGAAVPGVKLHLSGTNSRLRLQSTASNMWTTTEYFTNNRVWHTGVGGSTVSTDVKGKYYIRDHTAGAERLVINTNGNVGIGTTNPTQGKLHVTTDSATAVYGFSNSSYGVRGESNGGFGVYGFSNSSYAGYFDGDAHISGALEAFGGLTVVGGCTGCSPPSDRSLKANFSTVNPRFILDRLSTLPIQQWNYKSESDAVRHIGPMAQDFRAAFGLGENDQTLNTVDAQGVTMAAIQGLYQQNKELTRTVQQLRVQAQQQQTQLNQVKRAIKRSRTARR